MPCFWLAQIPAMRPQCSMPEYGKCCHPILFFHKHSCSYLHSDIEIGVIGGNVDLTYDYHYLGNSSSALDTLLEGRSEFSKVCIQKHVFAKFQMNIGATISKATIGHCWHPSTARRGSGIDAIQITAIGQQNSQKSHKLG
jgi:hypothetical protein